MYLLNSAMISEIDNYASSFLGIPTEALMHKAARAVEREVRAAAKKQSSVLILAGKGNNGGDGYALATLLKSDYRVTVVDVFSAGQRSEAGRYYLEKYKSMGGEIIDGKAFAFADYLFVDVVVDAIFGTGFKGEIPECLEEAVKLLHFVPAYKIAVDVPLGVDADTGEVNDEFSYTADLTVSLSYIKKGLMSYPAKKSVGRLINDNLSLPNHLLEREFSFDSYGLDDGEVKKILPKREDNSNKGSFGKVLIVTGSEQYRGAAHLSLEAALRAGCGIVYFVGEDGLCAELRQKLPEAIYRSVEKRSVADIAEVISLSKSASSVLVGSGSGKDPWLFELITELLSEEGCPLILDADAINLLSERAEGLFILKHKKRQVILTPHPLEFARLLDKEVSYVQNHRLPLALDFAKEYGVTLVLKGAATVVTDGEKIFINTSGSSALAKGGSGDVLAGAIASLSSFCEPLYAAAAMVYLHGKAADSLSESLSEFSVIPSDLPKEIGRQIKLLYNEEK